MVLLKRINTRIHSRKIEFPMYLHFYPDREQSIIPLDNPSRWFPRSDSYLSTRKHLKSAIFHDYDGGAYLRSPGPFFLFKVSRQERYVSSRFINRESLLYNARSVDLMFLGSPLAKLQ